MEYAVKVGADGAAFCPDFTYQAVREGNDGGDTTFAGFTAPGGRGGVYGSDTSFDTPAVSNGCEQEPGTDGTSGKGGDSFFAAGGKNSMSGSGGAGSMGSGGGAAYKTGNDGTHLTGKGGDGLVIICGVRPL